MSDEPLHWIDQAGTAHQLRLADDLIPAERQQLDVLRQQFQLSAFILDAGYPAPTVAQARPNMMRMVLRILLPNVAEQEIATFDQDEGHSLLVQWWASADAVP